ncbi:MAG: OmpA family protein [Cellvibrionaceae bacterium]
MNKNNGFIAIIFCSLFFSFANAQSIVEKQVLPVDSDNDGVIDSLDKCYKTAAGAKVDEHGCYISITEVKEINLNINFDVDSAVVKPEYFGKISEVATFMTEYPLTRATIEGHTDSDADNAYNKALSQRRAGSVARLLVTRYNIPVIRVTAVGFGEEQPLVPNNSPENKFTNRRVVAFIRSIDKEPASGCCDKKAKKDTK